MNNSPSPDCEKTICKMYNGKKGNEKNCNKVYYYLDSTKTHPDGGWFTCRNGGADDACRSKARKKTGFSFGQVREKPGDEFYGKEKTKGILYNAFKDTFDRMNRMNTTTNDRRTYVFQMKKGAKCGGSFSKNPRDKIVYLVPRKMLNPDRGIVGEINQKNLEAGDLVDLIRTFKTNFLFKTAQDGKNGWFKKMLEDKTLGSLGNLSQPQLVTNKRQQQKFDEERREEERQYIAQIEEETRRRKEKMEKRRTFATPPNTQGGSGTKRKRKKRRRKTRVKRKKTQKRKKAKRKYKKRRTKRRR